MQTDFQTCFSDRFLRKLSVSLIEISTPPKNLNYVATLPCEILKFKITADLLLINLFYVKLSKPWTNIRILMLQNIT